MAEVFYQDDWLTLWQGDCRAAMAAMEPESVHAVVTSPPYLWVRDYGVDPVTWDDGWRGSLGLEPSAKLYVDHLVEVFRGVRRVLRDDGVAWLVLGDSYAKQPKPEGMKFKDLVGLPWMAAFGLRDDGWYLRSDCVWNKTNAIPDPAKDRPSSSHEFIFMLTKQPSGYHFDMDAVKEMPSESTVRTVKARLRAPTEDREFQHDSATRMGKRSPNRMWSDPATMERMLVGRHMRDVLNVAYEPYEGAHYAPFPSKLIEPLIKAATSEKGCCPECGAQLKRVTKLTKVARGDALGLEQVGEYDHEQAGSAYTETNAVKTAGWMPGCNHSFGEAIPCVVFDPFLGSGTTLMVAQRLSRRGIGVDLNFEYLEQALMRNAAVPMGL